MINSNTQNINLIHKIKSKYSSKYLNKLKQIGSANESDEIIESDESDESDEIIDSDNPIQSEQTDLDLSLDDSKNLNVLDEVNENQVEENDINEIDKSEDIENIKKMEDTDEPEYTILDELIKKNKQFIILVMGLPCTSKSELAKELVVDLRLPILNISDYLIQDKYIDKEVDGVKFKIYEHPDNYDWEKLNYDVNRIKKKGVIIYGNYLDFDKIKWIPDIVYFISMNINLCKDKLIEKKLLPYQYDNSKISLYFTKIFNPIYEEIKTKFKINKFFNIKENTKFDEIYNELFDNLVFMVRSKLKNLSKFR